MASGSRGRGQGSAGAGAGANALDTLTNPDLAHLPAVDLVVHLHRDDGRSGSDFADVALVLAVRERRLAETEARVRAADVVAAGLRDRIRALELRERRLAEVEARVREAEVVAAGLHDTIRALELRVANAEALARDRTVVACEDEESQAGDITANDDIGAAELTGGEIRARNLDIVVPELPAGEITPGVCFEAGVKAATPGEVGDNMPSPSPSPSPLMRIDAFPPVPVTAAPALPDELIEERAVERVVVDVAVPRSHEVAQVGVAVDCRDKVSEAIARKRKKQPASDLSLPLDDLRVTGHKVSEEEAHGEGVAASTQRRSQGEQLARATKKARRKKGTGTSFYTMVFKSLMEKQKLLKKREKEEAFSKKVAATASKHLHCRCWSNAPYLPSKTAAVKDDSDDGESSQN